MMNMAKLGTVIQSKTRLAKNGNPRKQRAGGLMRYTLCVFQGWANRNGSRHGFAFDIPAISGRALKAYNVEEKIRATRRAKNHLDNNNKNKKIFFIFLLLSR